MKAEIFHTHQMGPVQMLHHQQCHPASSTEAQLCEAIPTEHIHTSTATGVPQTEGKRLWIVMPRLIEIPGGGRRWNRIIQEYGQGCTFITNYCRQSPFTSNLACGTEGFFCIHTSLKRSSRWKEPNALATPLSVSLNSGHIGKAFGISSITWLWNNINTSKEWKMLMQRLILDMTRLSAQLWQVAWCSAWSPSAIGNALLKSLPTPPSAERVHNPASAKLGGCGWDLGYGNHLSDSNSGTTQTSCNKLIICLSSSLV